MLGLLCAIGYVKRTHSHHLPRLRTFASRLDLQTLDATDPISVYFNRLSTKRNSDYLVTAVRSLHRDAHQTIEGIYYGQDLRALASTIACTSLQLCGPRPVAFPDFCFPRTHVAASATTASHTSYQDRPVGSPVISIFTLHLPSAVQSKQARSTYEEA